MRPVRAMCLVVAVGLMVMAGLALSAPVYAQTLFGATGRDRQFVATSDFYSIDPTTGTATLIGPVGFSSVSGMAFHPTTGVLYAVGFNSSGTHVLLTIDRATGVGTAVGSTNVSTASGCSDRVSDISFRSDGTLYAYAESCDQVGVINTSTGAFTLLGSTGQVDTGNGIAFSPGDVLFHAGGVNVGTLDQTTGVLTPGAALTFPGTCLFGRVNAMDFQPGSGALFVVMRCDSSTRRLGTLDTTTGVITDIGASVTQLDAIAFQPQATIEPPLTDFRDVRRPNDINIGPDLGGTNHSALNFTGNTGAAGDTWITVYDPAPNPPPVTFGSVSLSADVLIHTFNNKKGAGLLALYNEASAKKGLALTLYDAGNTDILVLSTVDQAGKLVTLRTVSLGAAITENVWHRVSMDVTVDGGGVSVIGTVVRHETPTDPDSPLTTQVGPTLTFSATLGIGALIGVDATGEVGILAAAVNAANSSTVTNVLIDPQGGGTSCLSTSRC
jgi:hypothetical protein